MPWCCPLHLSPYGGVSEWSDGGLGTLHLLQNILFWTARQPESSLALVAVTAALDCKTPLAQLCQMLGRSGVKSAENLHSRMSAVSQYPQYPSSQALSLTHTATDSSRDHDSWWSEPLDLLPGPMADTHGPCTTPGSDLPTPQK